MDFKIRWWILFCLPLIIISNTVFAQWRGKFEQLGHELPTPNRYRTASGAPGPSYWQQRADYVIDVEVDDQTQILSGKETVTYHNNSPQPLAYLWLQLEQNKMKKSSGANLSQTNEVRDSLPAKFFASNTGNFDYDGGFNILSVVDQEGRPLSYWINDTMMRIDLPVTLKAKETFTFTIAWNYHEYDRLKFSERGGYEYFPEDGNYVYSFAQWYPRLCVYDDVEGWQNKQFLGDGEFALTFGDFRVKITVPADHIVGATGWIRNLKEVLTREQLTRFEKAQKSFDQPVFIVTEEEARKKEKHS